MPRCAHCHRPGEAGLCGRCGKNHVCHQHDGADRNGTPSQWYFHPLCLACRWGWPK